MSADINKRHKVKIIVKEHFKGSDEKKRKSLYNEKIARAVSMALKAGDKS